MCSNPQPKFELFGLSANNQITSLIEPPIIPAKIKAEMCATLYRWDHLLGCTYISLNIEVLLGI